MGRYGMVTSTHPLASQAGMRILTQGGNAFDATVAVVSTPNMVEPMFSGIGGAGFALAHVRQLFLFNSGHFYCTKSSREGEGSSSRRDTH